MASRPSSFFSTLTCVGDAYGARRGERPNVERRESHGAASGRQHAAAATAKKRMDRKRGRRRRASFSQGSQMRMEQPCASRDTMTLWLTSINCWWQ